MAKSINTLATVAHLSTFPLDALNTELIAMCKMPAMDDAQTVATILGGRINTLDELTAMTVNLTEGNVDRESFKNGMETCFPEHTISDRHVGHYLSLARKGNLSGKIECRFTPVKATRKPNTSSKFKVTLDVRTLTAEQYDGLIALGIEIPEYER